MSSLMTTLLMTAQAYAAGEGSGHSHGAGGETEHLWPVLGVFLVLVVVGVGYNLVSKKKK
jgi:hypothetical protein